MDASSSRRIVPEDTVIYALYPDDSSPASLQSIHRQILDAISPHLRDYIWQHEPFQLSTPPSEAATCRLCGTPGNFPHLHGKTRYGDNVEDEWFLVFLLYEVSKKMPSLSIRVWDTDGEFLLIEAAYLLPRWLNPENSANRVFIRRGEVHILDRKIFPLGSAPELGDALTVLRSEGVETKASDGVQAAIGRRVSGYPEKARTNMHSARVRVPLPVAQVLKQELCLISLAVEGFYDRDVDSMKYASRMEKFLRSDGGGVDIVQLTVRMSRAMYGQLVQQSFQSPKCYPMPSRDEGPMVFGEAELGMKIACGFEMMYQERRRAGEEGKGTTWEAYKESLRNSGYFKDLLPGSAEYRRLMHEAEENYKCSTLFARTSNVLNAPVRRIDEILSLPSSIDDFKGVEVPCSDDDSWLYNGEDELNSAIMERQKEIEMYELQQKKPSDDFHSTLNSSGKVLDDSNIGDMTKTLQAFVEKISSFEGAEVPEDSDLKEVSFDVNRFMESLGLLERPTCEQQTDSDLDLEGHSSSSDMDYDESDGLESAHPLGEADNSGNIFMQSYSDALNEELRETTLKKSFIQAQRDIPNSGEGTSNTSENLYGDMNPVDVDVNLVKNLLDSYSSQQGLPGPASNILGSLGLKLPDDKDDKSNNRKMGQPSI